MNLSDLDVKLANENLSPANRKILEALRKRLVEKGNEVSASEKPQGPACGVGSELPVESPAIVPKSPVATVPVLVHEDSENNIKIPTAIELNEQQQLAVTYAVSGQSFVLTGAAGTGKTTTMERMVSALLSSGRIPPVSNGNHKYLKDGSPGIVMVSFTNKAVENAKKRLSHDMRQNCMTIHKLLEFEPVQESVEQADGSMKKSMRFEPKRNDENPLPSSLKVVIIDESTMVSVEHWNLLVRCLVKMVPEVQIILMGDIQQLPPVFGKSIFIHAMQRGFPVVELKHVYRQALESPILSLAHRILSGKVIPKPELDTMSVKKEAGELVIKPWKKSFTQIQAETIMIHWLPQQIDSGMYNPEEDCILTPYNEAFGTIMMNEIIASHYARKLNADVYEVFTGTQKRYFRVGERVLWNKSEADIINIQVNRSYFGKTPRTASNTMDYKGIEHDRTKTGITAASDEDVEAFVDRMLSETGSHTEDGSPAKRAASHVITVRSRDTGEERNLSAAGDINNLLLAYAITVHKSQGSEYRRVFLLLHKSQATMIFRELLYTAVTRAKEFLFVLCEPSTFVAGLTSQRVPGKTIADKIKEFDKQVKLEARYGGNDSFYTVPNQLDRFLIKRELITQ